MTTSDFAPTAAQADRWEELQRLWPAGSRVCRGVFWFGASYVGKTRLATEFVRTHRRLLLPENRRRPGDDRRVSVEFAGRAAELVAEVQAAIGGNADARDLWTMLRQVKDADIVLLDDLGREREGFGQDVMFQLLDGALQSPRHPFVIVTANRSARALAEHYGDDDALRTRLTSLQQREWPASMPVAGRPGGAA